MAKETKPPKVAKVLVGKEQWLVFDPDKGWIDATGNTFPVQASERHTKWFVDLSSAKIAGFSPSAAQASAIAKWDAPKAPTKASPDITK